MIDQVWDFLSKIHFAEITTVYLLVLKILTVIQDAIDAKPKDLKPPFGTVIYFLTALGGSLGLGNRPQPIQKTGA